MGRYARYVLCAGLLLVAVPGCLAYGQRTVPRDQAEAWKWMQASLKAAKITNAKLENEVIAAQCADCTSSKDFTIHLYGITSASISYPYNTNTYAVVEWHVFPWISTDPGRLIWESLWYADVHAERFKSALIYLARQTQKEDGAKEEAFLQDFKPKALAWQQMAVKPALPEEAQRHQVLAAYAYKNKDIPKAIDEYLEALNIYPYWPDGQNNVAYLCAEVGSRRGYQLAAYHMKMYLMLAPNAADAKAAQDSIFIWEDKAKAPAQ